MFNVFSPLTHSLTLDFVFMFWSSTFCPFPFDTLLFYHVSSICSDKNEFMLKISLIFLLLLTFPKLPSKEMHLSDYCIKLNDPSFGHIGLIFKIHHHHHPFLYCVFGCNFNFSNTCIVSKSIFFSLIEFHMIR